MTGCRTISILALIALTAAPALAQPATDTVVTRSGAVRGASTEDVITFKGIPFAAPPVAELRWQAPRPAPAWRGVRDARAFGAVCMQEESPADGKLLTAPSEDCLTLNVWTPAGRGAARKSPVIVWIHGGGLVNGGTANPLFDGSSFARHDIVLVSANYRLGRFGFFAHPALTHAREGPLANYGLMDQIAALKWVRANIGAFGGDPANVTIVGESAGGISILNLLGSPAAKGLFQRAVAMSGAGRDALKAVPLRSARPEDVSAESIGERFARKNGIDGRDATALAQLRALPAQAIAAGSASKRGPLIPRPDRDIVGAPIIDGRIVVAPVERRFETGAIAAVPLMVGATSADIGFPEAETMAGVLAPFGPAADRARIVFDPGNSGDVATVGGQIARVRHFIEPARFTARAMSDKGMPAWHYRFSYVAEHLRPTTPGARHFTDVPYLFDTVDIRYGDNATAADRKMADALQASIVAFARTGTPTIPGVASWPTIAQQPNGIMDFGRKGQIAFVEDPIGKQLDMAAGVDSTPTRKRQ